MDDVKAYIYITSSGYDPEKGEPVKDPYLGDTPTLGACMTNIRRNVVEGDHIFVVSGKIPNVPQYIIGGFEVAEKISAMEAYARFPKLRLTTDDKGRVTGNVICDQYGDQHPLDHHQNFERRLQNYVVGTNPLVLTGPLEIARARRETPEMLARLCSKQPQFPLTKLLGRGGKKLDGSQINELRSWLESLKRGS